MRFLVRRQRLVTPDQPLIDPSSQSGYLCACQSRTLGRHLMLGLKARDITDQATVLALANLYGFTGIAASDGRIATIQAQAASCLSGPWQL